MKKKWARAIVIIMLSLSVFAFTVSAEDDEIKDKAATFVQRIEEWAKDNSAEVISTAGTVVLGAIALYVKNKAGTSNAALNSTMNAANEKTVETKLTVENMANAMKSAIEGMIGSNNNVVDVANNLIGTNNEIEQKYTEMKDAYENYTKQEAERTQCVNACLVATTAVLEILSTVYPNSDLPTGVKDMVQIKAAKAFRMIAEDETVQKILQKQQKSEVVVNEAEDEGTVD